MKNDEIIRIPVYMLDEEARLFVEFQKYYELFNFLLDRKVSEQKGASIVLNFDAFGNIGSITRSDVLYLSNKKFDNDNPKCNN